MGWQQRDYPVKKKLVYCFLFPFPPNGGFTSQNTRVDTRVILNLIHIKLLHERVHKRVNVFRKEAKIFFTIGSTITFSKTTLQHAFTLILFPTSTTPSQRTSGSHYENTQRDQRSCKWRKLQLLREGASSVPRIFFRGEGQQIQLRTEGRQNGDLGAVAP
jgi:hypothetical protein